MKKGTMFFTAVLVGGCAAGTDTRDNRSEDMQYRNENERIEARERFEGFKRSCARSGGIVFMERHYGGRLAKTPTPEEMKTASCSPPAGF